MLLKEHPSPPNNPHSIFPTRKDCQFLQRCLKNLEQARTLGAEIWEGDEGREARILESGDSLKFGRLPTTPDPNTSARALRYKWEAYRDTNWWCIYYFLPRVGHTFAKVSRHNWEVDHNHVNALQKYRGQGSMWFSRWMAGTFSVNCLSCGITYHSSLHSLNALPKIQWTDASLHWFLLRHIPFPKLHSKTCFQYPYLPCLVLRPSCSCPRTHRQYSPSTNNAGGTFDWDPLCSVESVPPLHSSWRSFVVRSIPGRDKSKNSHTPDLKGK